MIDNTETHSNCSSILSSFIFPEFINKNNEYNLIDESLNIFKKEKNTDEDKNLSQFNCLKILLPKKNKIIVTYLSYMFSGCSSLESISGLSKLNTNNLLDISHLFENCTSLSKIFGISQWIINNINDINNIFAGCSKLLSLSDISKWNTEKVENMNCIFYNCSMLESLPDIS